MEVTELSELLEARDIKSERARSCDFHDGEPDAETDDPLIVHFTNEGALGMMAAGAEGEILQPLSGFEEPPDEDTAHSSDSAEDVIVQLMDIRTRLSTLRGMLERRLAADLTHYTFWLQDAKELESHKTLVDQCIKGEGVVQVNLQLKPLERRINILDVLKPDEELIDLAPPPDDAETPEEVVDGAVDGVAGMEVEAEVSAPPPPAAGAAPPHAAPHDAGKQPLHSTMVKWIVDEQFQSDRSRLKMPEEPADWSVAHVRLWIQWAVRQFNLTGIKLPDWSISGEQLCAMSLHDFREKCPSDPGDIFWTHFELLRKCKFIAVIQKEDGCGAPRAAGKDTERQYAVKRKKPQPPHQMITEAGDVMEYGGGGGGGGGGGTLRGASTGQIHLWQFLLELLTTADHLPVIQWHGTEGEFKLVEPERVARLWGSRKHKPAMNYEKLSRALRYYYDGDMIAKVNGKRFVYKFVCDLRQLVGYSAGELARLVSDTYEQRCAPTTQLNNTD